MSNGIEEKKKKKIVNDYVDARGRIFSKKEIFDYYIVNKHTRKETGAYFQVSESYIKNLLSIFNLKKSTKDYSIFTYSLLYDLYITKNMTCGEIAKQYDVCKDTILNRLKKFNIVKPKELQRLVQSRIEKSPEKQEKMRQTCIRKYGVEHVANNPEFMKKREENNLKKYGVKNIMQLDEIKEKVKSTCLLRYGYTSAIKNPKVFQKQQNTNAERYGVENQFQRKELLLNHRYKYYYDNLTFDSS